MLRDVAYAKQRRYLRSFSFWLPIQAPECGSAFDPFCLHPVEGFFVNDGWIEVITEVVLRHQQTFCGSVEGFDPGIIGGILQAHSVEVIGVKHAFMEAQKQLTLKGNIVISVGLFGHSGDDEVWTEGTKEMLDDMHKRKIDMADEIFVINVGGYIGSSTRSEIEYAQATGKPVRYLEADYTI